MNGAGVASMCVYSPNGFLGLRDEDECVRHEVSKVKRHLTYTADQSLRYDVIEGHVLLLGGSDANPSVKVMQPHVGGMREIVTLQGHSKAVTHIQADAAGRWDIMSYFVPNFHF